MEEFSLEEPQDVSIEEIESNVSNIDTQPDVVSKGPFNQKVLKNYKLDTGLFSLSNSDGDRIYVTEEELPNVLTNPGWNLEPVKLYNAIKDAEFKASNLAELGGGYDQAWNSVNSVFNAATGGLSDLIRLGLYKGLDTAGDALGIEGDFFETKIEYENALREANPLVSLTGDIAGLLNPYGVYARGGKAVYGVSKGLFTKVIGESAEGGFKKWGTKALAGGFTGFAEGQAYRAQSYVTESILSNTDMNAESFFSNQSSGAGWDFLIGGAISGVPGVLSAGRKGLSKLLTKSKPGSYADEIFNTVSRKSGNPVVQSAKNGVAQDILSEIDGTVTHKTLLTETNKYSDRLDEAYDDILKKTDEGVENIKVKNEQFLDNTFAMLDDVALGHPDANRLLDKLEDIKTYSYDNIPTSTKDLIKLSKNLDKIKDADDLTTLFKKQIDGEILSRLDDAGKETVELIGTKREVIEEFSQGLKTGERATETVLSTDGIVGDLIAGTVIDSFDGDLSLTGTLSGAFIKRYGVSLLKKGIKNRAMKYFRAQQVIDATEEVINVSVKKSLFNRPSGISASSTFLTRTEFEDLPKGASKEDKIEYLTIKLDEYGEKTDMLEQRTIAGVSGYEKDFPETTKGVIDRNIKLVELLKSKIPRNPRSNSMNLQNQFNKRPWKPSHTEIRTFEKYLSAAVSPMTVFEDIGNGRVSREQLETLEVLYPEMTKYLMGSVINAVSSSDKPVPYANRLKLSLVLGMPLDSSLEPANIRALQLLGTPQEKVPDTGMVSSVAPKLKPTQSGLNKLKIGSRGNSTLDAALNRGLE